VDRGSQDFDAPWPIATELQVKPAPGSVRIRCGKLALSIPLRYNFVRSVWFEKSEREKYMSFAPVEGGQIHYRFDGRQELPALVLSNSLGTDLSMWDAQVPAFTQHFRVLRYDSYGHGASTFAACGFRIDRLGQDVVRLLDHLGIATVSFCGLSVGGLVGQWLGLHAAERLKKLVLCNTAAHIGTADGWNARIDAVKKDGLASISNGILERWFTPSFHEREPRTVDRFRKILEATPAESYVATCAAIRDADLRSEVSKISVRTLVIAGTQDKATPPEGGRYLAERIVASRYVEFDTAHLSNVELPQRFSGEVLKFLTQRRADG
jgi:3-oxoadipate enol-lactonase